MQEWKVLKDGELYGDRFNSEDLALDYIEHECEDLDGEFTVELMTEEDMLVYE